MANILHNSRRDQIFATTMVAFSSCAMSCSFILHPFGGCYNHSIKFIDANVPHTARSAALKSFIISSFALIVH